MARPDYNPNNKLEGVESYFGFSKAPFSFTTDMSFFYPAPSQIRILKKILQQYETDYVRMLVTGKKGTGKMTLAMKLSSLLTQSGKVEPKIIMPENLNSDDSLRILLSYFDTTWKGTFSATIDALKADLTYQKMENYPVFLILHRNRIKLSSENVDIFSELLRYKFCGKPVFHFLWFTDQEPDESMEPLTQLVNDVESLENLPFYEMVEMVNFRCHAAGRSQPFFTSSAFNAIFAHTNGHPEVTMRLCLFAMDETRINKKEFCDAEEVEAAWERWFTKGLFSQTF